MLDDASGVGTVDNVLLPLVGVGLLAVHLLGQAPPSLPDFGALWQDMVVAMQAVGTRAETVKQEAARALPKREDCGKHVQRCFETPLATPHSGGTWNYSTCADCLVKCRGQKLWPDVDHQGKSCRWWELLGIIPPINYGPGAIHDAN